MRRSGLRFGLFGRRAAVEAAWASATPAEPETDVPLTAGDEERVEAEVRRMIAELRAKPSQEKEDRIGVEIARLPAAERDLVPAILLRIVAEESGR